MIAVVPVEFDATQGNTRPEVTWPLMKVDPSDPEDESLWTPLDITDADRSCELWYWEEEQAGNLKRALWKVTLEKVPGVDDNEVRWSPDDPTPMYPDALVGRGRGLRTFVGWILYRDAGTAIPTVYWIKRVLVITAEAAPLEPA